METWFLSILLFIIGPYVVELSKEAVKLIAKATVSWITNKSLDKLKELKAKPKEETTENLAQRTTEVRQVTNTIIIVIQDISRQHDGFLIAPSHRVSTAFPSFAWTCGANSSGVSPARSRICFSFSGSFLRNFGRLE